MSIHPHNQLAWCIDNKHFCVCVFHIITGIEKVHSHIIKAIHVPHLLIWHMKLYVLVLIRPVHIHNMKLTRIITIGIDMQLGWHKLVHGQPKSTRKRSSTCSQLLWSAKSSQLRIICWFTCKNRFKRQLGGLQASERWRISYKNLISCIKIELPKSL